MVPELTRRRLLGGLAVTGASTGLVAVPRTWYPDPVVDRMIGRRRLPETDARPPVPEAVLDEGIDSLADHLDRAESLWTEIDADRDDLPDDARYGRTHLSTARDRYEDLQGASADRDALFDLRRAHGDAGFAIGAGRLARGETDAEALVDRGERLRDEIDDVREGIEYRGDDPAADTATLFRIEEALVFARLDSHRNGVYAGGVASPEEYEGHAFPLTWQANLQAEISLLEARHTDRAFEDAHEADRSFADGVEAAFEAFADEVDRTHQSHEERAALLEDFPEGPYRHARFQCWQLTHGDLDALFGDLRAELRLSRTVYHARNVLKLRAYPDAVDRLELEPGEDPDPALAYRAERRAARRLRDLADEHDSPLFRLVVDDAAGLLRNGHVGLRRGWGSAEARERAEAYVYYLLADAQLRHAVDVYDDLLARLE